jgi:hypothetical protein
MSYVRLSMGVVCDTTALPVASLTDQPAPVTGTRITESTGQPCGFHAVAVNVVAPVVAEQTEMLRQSPEDVHWQWAKSSVDPDSFCRAIATPASTSNVDSEMRCE